MMSETRTKTNDTHHAGLTLPEALQEQFLGTGVIQSDTHPTGKPKEDRARFENRFWEKVNIQEDDACWKWQATTETNGYGRFWVSNTTEENNGRNHKAHRIAYQLCIGAIPAGHVVHHTCREKNCVNPRHLKTIEHGLHSRRAFENGELELPPKHARVQGGKQTAAENHMQKITASEADDIRRTYHNNPETSYRSLAEEYGVAKSTIGRIIRGERKSPTG